jgi:hypothetical protein
MTHIHPDRIQYLRPPHGWAEANPHFGRCSWCGGMSLRGICQNCGHATVCSHCRKVRLPDGSWQEAPARTGASDRISHSICHECKWILYPDIALRIAQTATRKFFNILKGE